MKHSKSKYTPLKNTSKNNLSATLLMWLVPLLLIVPNVILDFTERSYTVTERIINIALPAGLYLLLSAWNKNIGRTTLFFLPIMILCAFQIVLLHLYGESIIAIDMFLNVVTTNYNEATELLKNLTVAIAIVCALYLPPLIAGGVAIKRRHYTPRRVRVQGRRIGAVLIAVGVVATIVAVCTSGIAMDRSIFPVNVTSNMIEAVKRTAQTANYAVTSENYKFGAVSHRQPDEREIYVLVVGETARANNWQMLGYDRATNPCMNSRKESGQQVFAYNKVLTESNTTHKSVPLMLSHLSSETFGDSIMYVKSIITTFKEAGFKTVWLSNQQHNNSYIDFFGNEADVVDFVVDDESIDAVKHNYDSILCERLSKTLDALSNDNKIFVVLHTYGSHFNYNERYPSEYSVFKRDDNPEAEASNRDVLINAYDNTICFTDALLDNLIKCIHDRSDRKIGAMLYLSDHGEDIFDDKRGRFLHASPAPTYWQIRVPLLLWMSDEYIAAHPGKADNARNNLHKNISSSRSAFHTMLSLAGITCPVYRPYEALTEISYTEPRRSYLTDYNEDVSLINSGLHTLDMEQLSQRGIAVK